MIILEILKKRRKPTEIILTDGFSYSATSSFIKYLQIYGSAIIVGNFGNPLDQKVKFENIK